MHQPIRFCYLSHMRKDFFNVHAQLSSGTRGVASKLSETLPTCINCVCQQLGL